MIITRTRTWESGSCGLSSAFCGHSSRGTGSAALCEEEEGAWVGFLAGEEAEAAAGVGGASIDLPVGVLAVEPRGEGEAVKDGEEEDGELGEVEEQEDDDEEVLHEVEGEAGEDASTGKARRLLGPAKVNTGDSNGLLVLACTFFVAEAGEEAGREAVAENGRRQSEEGQAAVTLEGSVQDDERRKLPAQCRRSKFDQREGDNAEIEPEETEREGTERELVGLTIRQCSRCSIYCSKPAQGQKLESSPAVPAAQAAVKQRSRNLSRKNEFC